MKTLVLSQIAASMPLTQAYCLEATSDLVPNPIEGPVAFTTTLAAPLTFRTMIKIDVGNFDIDHLVTRVYHWCENHGTSLTDFRSDLVKLLRSSWTSTDSFLSIVSSATGSANKPANLKHVAKQTPTQIERQIRKRAGAVSDINIAILTDFVSYAFSTMGWLIFEEPIVIESKNVKQFPCLADAYDMVELVKIRRLLTQMRSVDLTALKKHLEIRRTGSQEPLGVSPTLISTELAKALTKAISSLRGEHNTADVVHATLDVVLRLHDPEIPSKAEISKTIQSSPHIAGFMQNYALLSMAQEMQRKSVTIPAFDQSQMKDEVLQTFADAIASNRRFTVTPLTDVVGHLQSQQAVDHTGRPIFLAISENWAVDNTVQAFDTISIDQQGQRRYLEPFPSVSTRLSDSMNSAMMTMDLRRVISTRIGFFDSMIAETRAAIESTSMMLALPSFLYKLYQLPVPDSIKAESSDLLFCQDLDARVKDLLPEAEATKMAEAGFTVDRVTTLVKEAVNDAYTMLMHYAIAYADDVKVARLAQHSAKSNKVVTSSHKLAHRAALQLQFTFSTPHKVALGKSAIVNSALTTCEPLEAIAYIGKKDAAVCLKKEELDLTKYEDNLHVWPWFNHSNTFGRTHPYAARLAGSEYPVRLRANEMIGSGTLPSTLRTMKPYLAASIASLWFEVFEDTQDAIANLRASNATDKAVQAALDVRDQSSALALVMHLERISASVMGQNSISFVHTSLQNELYDKGRIDTISMLHKGIENMRLRVWIGLAIINQLGLVNQNQIDRIAQFIRDNNAINQAVTVSQTANSLDSL